MDVERSQPAELSDLAGGTLKVNVDQVHAYPGQVFPNNELGVHVRFDGCIDDEPRHIVALLVPAVADALIIGLESAVAAAEKASFELEQGRRHARADPVPGVDLRDDVDVIVALVLRVRDRHGVETANAHLRDMLGAYPPSMREALLRAALLALAVEAPRAC